MKKKIVNGALIGVSVLMLGGMLYMFTPMAGSVGGASSKTALKVNDLNITVKDLEDMRKQYQQNPSLSVLFSSEDGLLADDVKTFLVAQNIRAKAMLSGSNDVKVSKQEVSKEIDKIRKQNNLEDNKAWTDALSQRGFSDSSFRANLQEQLTIQKKTDALKKTAKPATEEELKVLYELNKEKYQSAPKIVGRQIVTKDKATAEKALARAKVGENFASLARELSTEFKDRGGALGPLENGSPRPVERAVLPSAVADAAFALENGGLTKVIEVSGKFYVVRVDKFLKPAPKPFAEVKDEVEKLAKDLKENAIIEKWVLEQEDKAKIEVVDSAWKYYNPVIATVEGKKIKYAEVVGQVIGGQQAAMLFQQMPPEQAIGFLNSSFKPETVNRLIQSYAAPIIVKKSKLPLIGPQQALSMNLMMYGSRDVTVSEEEIKKHYEENKQSYGTPASANVMEASFSSKNAALVFRNDWDGKGDFISVATRAGGTVSERGNITEGNGVDAALEKAMFNGPLRGAGEGSLSEVVEVAGRYSIAYLTDLQKAVDKPLSEVRESIENQLISSKRSEKGVEYLKNQVDKLTTTNDLEKVLAEQQKRVEASQPKKEDKDKATDNSQGDSNKDSQDDATTKDSTNTSDTDTNDGADSQSNEASDDSAAPAESETPEAESTEPASSEAEPAKAP